jgi:hypothetical protein
MRFRHRAIVGTTIVLALGLAACENAPTEEEGEGSDVATVEPIQGTDIARVTLSEDAVSRLDIQTARIEESRTRPGKKPLETMPYAALLYDPNGDTWAYTNPEPLVFVRSPVAIARIDGDVAILSWGPPPGTRVVTVGAAELLGAEYEVGEE